MSSIATSTPAACADEVLIESSDAEAEDEDLPMAAGAQDEDLVDIGEFEDEECDADIQQQLFAALGGIEASCELSCGEEHAEAIVQQEELVEEIQGTKAIVEQEPVQAVVEQEGLVEEMQDTETTVEALAYADSSVVNGNGDGAVDMEEAEMRSVGSSSEPREDEFDDEAEDEFGDEAKEMAKFDSADGAEGDDNDADDDEDGGFFVDVEGAAEAEKWTAMAGGDELIQVPAGALEHIVGPDGTTLARLSTASGAELSLVPVSSSNKCALFSARGSPDVISVARRLILNIVAEMPKVAPKEGRRRKAAPSTEGNVSGGASGHAGNDMGICKWFAAGFCRNRAPSGHCRNGCHDSQGAQRAEASWVQEAPVAGMRKSAKSPVLLLMDLEGGGNQNGVWGDDEIIEVPVLAMCPVTGTELGRFHRFARPGAWDRKDEEMRRRFPAYCFNAASTAVPFPQVMREMRSFICKVLGLSSAIDLRRDDFLFVTCGNWDVKTVMPRQCRNPTPGTVDIETQQLLLFRWCNLKDAFRVHFNLSASAAPTGMRGMLSKMHIPLDGQHHLGMDDVSNLAKILRKLVLLGAVIGATGYAESKILRNGAPVQQGMVELARPQSVVGPAPLPAGQQILPQKRALSPQKQPDVAEEAATPASSSSGKLAQAGPAAHTHTGAAHRAALRKGVQSQFSSPQSGSLASGQCPEVSPPKMARIPVPLTSPHLLNSSILVPVQAESGPTNFWEMRAHSSAAVVSAPVEECFAMDTLPSVAPSRSGLSILSKYSAIRRADDAGVDIRIKKKDIPKGDPGVIPCETAGGKSRGGKARGRNSRDLMSLAGGSVRRSR